MNTKDTVGYIYSIGIDKSFLLLQELLSSDFYSVIWIKLRETMQQIYSMYLCLFQSSNGLEPNPPVVKVKPLNLFNSLSTFDF